MPKVTPTGDAFTFSVTSADDKDNYTVDVLANDGQMACTCTDWQCRCSPRCRNGGLLKPYGHPDRSICKHIDATLKDMGLKQLIDINGGAMTAAFTEKELRKITLFFGQVVAAKANGKERTEMFEDQI